MNSGRVKNTLRSAVFGIFRNIFTIVGQFLIRTLLIWRLGNEYVGADSLFTSILSVLNITELGIGSAMCYMLYKPIAENNQNEINAIANLNKKLCRYIGIAILLIGLALTPFLKFLVNKDVPDDLNIYILYFIYLANAVEGYFLYAYTVSVVNAYQRNDLENKALIIARVLRYCCQAGVLLISANYWLYVTVIPISTIVENIARMYLTKKYFPRIKCEGDPSKEIKKEIRKQVLALFGHRLNGTIIASADNLVISAFLGLTILGKYSNYYYIVAALVGMVDVFLSALRPSVGNSYVIEGRKESYPLFSGLGFLLSWITGAVSISLICVFQAFIDLWTGGRGILSISTAVLLVVLFYEWNNFNYLTIFKDAAGLWWEDRYRPYVACIANIVINILLVNVIGLNGVIMSTIMTRVLISWPWLSSVLFDKVFGRKPGVYFLEFIQVTIIMALLGIMTYAVTSHIQLDGRISTMIGKGVISIILPNVAMLIIFFRTRRFSYCLNKFKSYLRKNGKQRQ